MTNEQILIQRLERIVKEAKTSSKGINPTIRSDDVPVLEQVLELLRDSAQLREITFRENKYMCLVYADYLRTMVGEKYYLKHPSGAKILLDTADIITQICQDAIEH